MKTLTAIAAIVLALTLPACADAAKDKKAKTEAPLTEDQKSLYSLGVLMSQSISTFELTPEEVAVVQKGIADGISGKKSAEEAQADVPKIQELQRARMAKAGEKAAAAGVAYLDGKAKEAGFTKTASGMLINHTTPGTGASPKAEDEVKVHYEGRLIDGKVFDSSIKRGEPATFPLNGVIACWTEGVQTMKVGGKATFVCPANLAYGPNGSPPTIPPQATLTFDVELLEIVKK
ncbi:MAG: FKBP-type peptidylprolyl cis-trans isomerase [Steroidobacteraceae bacterium]|jgi:FKBP-type peptidyl-prolyl cis-trans isomerase|nr:FKBP-type peptidylprolyl cis-trans isomerase [Steroidobacteraceae bacterium]